jgi:hypothetical protein
MLTRTQEYKDLNEFEALESNEIVPIGKTRTRFAKLKQLVNSGKYIGNDKEELEKIFIKNEVPGGKRKSHRRRTSKKNRRKSNRRRGTRR